MSEPFNLNPDLAQPTSRNRLHLLELHRQGLRSPELEREIARHELGNQTGRISEVVLSIPLGLEEGSVDAKTEVTELDWWLASQVTEAFADRQVTIMVHKPSAHEEPAVRRLLEERRAGLGEHGSAVRFGFLKYPRATGRWARDYAFPNKNGFGVIVPSRYESQLYNVNQTLGLGLQTEVAAGGSEAPFLMEGGNVIVHDNTIHISRYTVQMNAQYYKVSEARILDAMQNWFQQPVVVIDQNAGGEATADHMDIIYTPLAPKVVAVADVRSATDLLRERFSSTRWQEIVREEIKVTMDAYNTQMKRAPLDRIRDKAFSYSTALYMQYASGELDDFGREQQAQLDAIAQAAEERGNTVLRLPYIPAAGGVPLVTYNNGLADNGRYVVAKFGQQEVSGRSTLFDEFDVYAQNQLSKAGVSSTFLTSAGLPHTVLGGSLRCRTVTFHEQ